MKNYDKLLQELIIKNERDGIVPSILLHSCCAPCSSYVIEYLANYFNNNVIYVSKDTYTRNR